MKNRNKPKPWKRSERQVAIAGKRPFHLVMKLQKQRGQLIASSKKKKGVAK